MRFAREACYVAYTPQDRCGQDGTYAEDLGEGAARRFHLGFDARVQVSDLPVQRPYVAQYLGGQAPTEAVRGAPTGPYATQDARCPVGREFPGHPAGE